MPNNKTIREEDVNEDIEKAYPEAYRLARKFHNLYEEIAPKFGYKTRGDTKAFEPASPNGRTMAYVCKEIVDEEVEKALLTQLSEIEDMVEEKIKKVQCDDKQEGSFSRQPFNQGRVRVLSDILTALKEKKSNLEKGI